MLNADDRTISRIDQKTRRIVKTFATGGLPTDLAFADGSLWVGNGTVTTPGALVGVAYTSSVARIDPDSVRRYHLRPASLGPRARPHSEIALPISRLAAYGGSLWAINPDLSVSRIDTPTNDVVGSCPCQVRRAPSPPGRKASGSLATAPT